MFTSFGSFTPKCASSMRANIRWISDPTMVSTVFPRRSSSFLIGEPLGTCTGKRLPPPAIAIGTAGSGKARLRISGVLPSIPTCNWPATRPCSMRSSTVKPRYSICMPARPSSAAACSSSFCSCMRTTTAPPSCVSAVPTLSCTACANAGLRRNRGASAIPMADVISARRRVLKVISVSFGGCL